MKKIMSIMLMTMISMPVMAEEKQQKKVRSYEIICSINDDRDGDREISKHTFTMLQNNGAAWKEHFKVIGSDHDLVMQVYYYDEDGIFVLELGDLTSQIGAQTVHPRPEFLYVFLGTPDAGVFANCNFKKAKKQKLPDNETPAVE